MGLKEDKRTDDPVQGGQNQDSELAELLSEACLADVRGMIEAAEGDSSVLAVIRGMFPEVVWERVGLS